MKFTRLFILKSLNIRNNANNPQNGSNEANPAEVLKDIIISHPNIDLTLNFILSIILLITKYNDDLYFIQMNSVNIYLISILNLTCLCYYFTLEYLDKATNNINLNTNNILNSTGDNPRNSQNNNNSNNDEVPVFDNNPTTIINPDTINNIPNIYTQIRLNNKLKIPQIIFDNWHCFKCFLHLCKIFLSISSFFLSLIFCMLYTSQKLQMNKEKYFLMHLLILDFYQFYSGFRVCYFLIKIMINILLIPVYISAVFLGYIEDEFNNKLNKTVQTRSYTGRSSLKNSNTARKSKVSEAEEYCSICLNSFQINEMVSTLPCSRRHTFHTVCLEKWFLTTVTCPLCRSDFQNSIDIFVNNNSRENRPIELNNSLL